jgi:hypothetical protein
MRPFIGPEQASPQITVAPVPPQPAEEAFDDPEVRSAPGGWAR